MRLQCEFDIAAGVSAEDIKDIVFSKFDDIAILSKMFLSYSVSQYFTFSILYNVLCTYLSLHSHCHCNDCFAACVANKLLHIILLSTK